jgi:hypothetical protein
MHRFVANFSLVGMTLFSAQSLCAQAGEHPPSLLREWRITRVVSAPWAVATHTLNSHIDWIGKTVRFNTQSVEGPGVLGCEQATTEATRYEAKSLFQGKLPKPATIVAKRLGIARLPVAGARLNCSTGSFEFHFVDDGTMLLGMDNQIFTLSRSPGTLAPATAPEGRTQQFLELHFNGDMEFTSDCINRKQAWFSKSLQHTLAAYFAKPAIDDEVPAIDGDPFTDSQSYPTRFLVEKAKIDAERAEVPVRFFDAMSQREVVYLLHYEGGNWQLDDLRFEGGEMLSRLAK